MLLPGGSGGVLVMVISTAFVLAPNADRSNADRSSATTVPAVSKKRLRLCILFTSFRYRVSRRGHSPDWAFNSTKFAFGNGRHFGMPLVSVMATTRRPEL